MLERKVTPQPRRHIQCNLRRLDQEGPAAAHRIDQGLIGLPACQAQDAGGEVFLERCLDRSRLEPALVERLARGIDIQGDRILGQIGVNPHRRIGGIDTGSCSAHRTKMITDGILDPQRGELEAFQGTVPRRDVDPDGLVGGEPLGPGHPIGEPVDILFGAIPAMRNLPHDPGGNPAFEVRPIAQRPVPRIRHTAGCGPDVTRTQRTQFVAQHLLQSARTGREEKFGHGLCIARNRAHFVKRV